MIKKDKENGREINTETYLKKKNKNREYGKNSYHNISEKDKKKRLKEYQKNYCELKILNIIIVIR